MVGNINPTTSGQGNFPPEQNPVVTTLLNDINAFLEKYPEFDGNPTIDALRTEITKFANTHMSLAEIGAKLKSLGCFNGTGNLDIYASMAYQNHNSVGLDDIPHIQELMKMCDVDSPPVTDMDKLLVRYLHDYGIPSHTNKQTLLNALGIALLATGSDDSNIGGFLKQLWNIMHHSDLFKNASPEDQKIFIEYYTGNFGNS